jgi:hypothetical protein
MSLTPQHRALIAQHGDSVADVRGRWSVDFDEHGIAAFIASVERAARAAAFREAADLCERWSDKWRPDVPVRDRYADGLSSGASELADALRARAESEAGHG